METAAYSELRIARADSPAQSEAFSSTVAEEDEINAGARDPRTSPRRRARGQVTFNPSRRICSGRDTPHPRRKTWRTFGTTSHCHWIIQSAASRRSVECAEGPPLDSQESGTRYKSWKEEIGRQDL